MKLLLIDDDPYTLELLSVQLATLGCADIVTCEHADEACRLLERGVEGVDLVITDLQMPCCDGVEIVRNLARLRYAGGLVLISGEDARIVRTAETLARAHGLNLLGALLKPVSRIELRGVLARASKGPLGRSRQATDYEAHELELAIAADQLVLHYQPQVNLVSGAMVGVESLVRWQHPRDGLVFPDRFISLAEQHGLIDILTHWVLKMALRQLRQWREQAGLAIDVSVNVSMDNLTALEFPDFVVRQLEKNGLPPSCLVLEITESRLMNNRLSTLDILTRLGLKHIRLSIDDFGTGHSSLAQLRDIPFGELKIDRSFVHQAAGDGSLQAIVEASLSMAHQLGMRTVAEGVEDVADWKYVRVAGCDAAQGHFIGRPMPADRLPAWLDDWRGRFDALVARRSTAPPRFESWPRRVRRNGSPERPRATR